MIQATPRTFTFGELLDGSFTLYRRNFVAFFGTALIPQVPVVVFWLTAPLWMGPQVVEDGGTMASLLLLPYTFFAWFLTLGALTWVAGRTYAGEETGIGEALREGLRRWFPVAAASIVMGIMVSLGFLLLIIPGLILFAMYFALLPAVVLEGRGPLNALGRSRTLSRNGRKKILGALFVAYLITLLPIFAFSFVGAFAGFAMEMSDGVMGSWFLVAVNAGGPFISALTTPFLLIVTVLLYFDRLARTEAPDLEHAMDQLQREA